MYPRPISQTDTRARVLYMTGVWTVLLVWLLPVFAIILTAFRTFEDVMAGNYWGWPTEINVIENFRAVFTQTDMWMYFVNSLYITIPSVVLVLVLSTMTGFVLSRYPFRGSTLLFAVFIAGNFMPQQVFMIPVRDLMVTLGLYDTYWSLIIFHVAFQTGGAVLGIYAAANYRESRGEAPPPGAFRGFLVVEFHRAGRKSVVGRRDGAATFEGGRWHGRSGYCIKKQ